MAASALCRKLLLRPGSRVALVNAPEGYAERLRPLPEGAALAESTAPGLDAVQVFVRDTADLDRLAPAFATVRPDGLLWVSYPKGGRKAGTELDRDVLRERMSRHGLAGVTLVAVDETWSAMRFRPAGRVGT